MSFPRYERYKESGVEWLGEVPEGWEVWKLSHSFKVIGSGTTPKADNAAFYDDGQTAWLNTGDLNDGELYNCSKQVSDLALIEHSSLKLYPVDSVVIAMYGATIGKLAILRFPATVNQACCVFSCSDNVISQFLFYWFLGFRQQIVGLATGGGQPNISQDILRNLRLALPPLPEQHTIGAFLDRETGKIDELVAEQERLIALLKEKRQATISHAVTKGLNPDAPMKDSGIEWLGEVPEGWEVTSFKRIASIRYGIGEPPKYQEEGTPLIRATNVNAGLVTQEGMVFVNPDDIPEKRIIWLSAGDIIVVRSGAYTGDSAIIKSEHCPCIAGFDMVVHPIACLPFFLQYALLSTYLKNDQLDLEKTRAAQPHLNAEELGSCVVVLPPSFEQSAITAFLDNETTKIDTLVGEAQQAIGLLKERRSALISAAVTGKIDVRGWV